MFLDKLFRPALNLFFVFFLYFRHISIIPNQIDFTEEVYRHNNLGWDGGALSKPLMILTR